MRRALKIRQRGAFAVAFAIFMVAIIGFISLSMDLSQVYVRQTELQGAVDAAAVVAARELNGTMTGLSTARLRAQRLFTANNYDYWNPLPWNPNLMSFAETADGPWIADGDVNAANVQRLRFVKIDTADGDADPGVVQMSFNAGSTVSIRHVAIAGPTATQLVPLAICAISTVPDVAVGPVINGKRERREFGFRRGVNYDLLKLNPAPSDPAAPTPASHFLVNPVDFPPAASNPAHFGREHVGPFACSGTMPFPPSRRLHVTPGFPSYLAAELNSRFEDYAGNRCVPTVAVPDRNVREYNRLYPGSRQPIPPGDPTAYYGTAAAGSFIRSDGGSASAGELGQRLNVAHLTNGPDDGTQYGSLWAYARPLSTGASFTRNDWNMLYPAVQRKPQTGSAYSDFQDLPYFTRPIAAVSPAALVRRRVMSVALLECPVPASGEATVLGIGNFLLTARAADGADPSIPAEFGGVLAEWGPAISSGLYK